MSSFARRLGRQQPRRGADPAGLPRLREPVPKIFNTDPARNVGLPTQRFELKALPDDRLIATLVELGCPRLMAEQVRHHGGFRFAAISVWCLVQDAAEGKSVQNALTGETRPAREIVDEIRAQYDEARKVELISDRPDHTIGLWER